MIAYKEIAYEGKRETPAPHTSFVMK
jgi:hypothetical protein